MVNLPQIQQADPNSNHILVSVLNWGLGHATRTIPIIQALLQKGYRVSIASDGKAGEVLKMEFPDLPYYPLAALELKYSKWFILGMILQIFKFKKWEIEDQKIRNQLLSKINFDCIISDSRLSIYSKRIPSVLIIHQLNSILPWPLKYFYDYVLRKKLNQFSQIWIPDLLGEHKLSAILSKTIGEKIPTRNIGLLTRIQYHSGIDQIPGRILAIVSGPEPLRTEFENHLMRALKDEDHFIIGGNPNSETDRKKNYISYCGRVEISEQIAKAEYIICRSGYSSLMDLAGWGKKLILVPTPGQTEQEYLAYSISHRNEGLIWEIKRIFWSELKTKLSMIKPFYRNNDADLLQNAIGDLGILLDKKKA